MKAPFFEIPYYHDFISPTFAEHLLQNSKSYPGVEELSHVGESGGLENRESLQFLVDLYEKLKTNLSSILQQRVVDRKFIDERVRACYSFNQNLGRDLLDADYKTILGLQDSHGRIVIGPKSENYARPGGNPVAPLPEYLKGPHVTLFGPPDSAKMAINAMNAFHRKSPTEPEIVSRLVGKVSPMWGADDEDSKTPLRADLIDAAVNLTHCFDGTLNLEEGNKKYSLAKDHLSLPIKRFPGLALPCSFLFYRRNPIPLHLYDFALHLFKNWKNLRALVFYVPKLETEEEAAYIHNMVATAEQMIHTLHPEYELGTIRLMIVLENPRAILRTHEIMDALHPYFAGASLGWHDYLASMARILKEDGNYQIPVKADPGIVYKYIRASHLLVADVVGSRGGIKVGGMYGILPMPGDHDSLQVTLRGFIKDIVSQMKRRLTGMWVAHPDFVRIGLALVEAWRLRETGDKESLTELVKGLLDPKFQREVLQFIESEDIEGLDIDDPNYVRSLLVADIKRSDFIANNDPEEIRYNVFQTLQYLTDWLSGNGCVALPTVIDGIPVRVMDDLATAERSRWEVWAELHHKRFPLQDFLKIAHEEMNFIRRDLSNEKKIVQVKWDERTEKWYPVAFKLMLKLMTDASPAEFATELLLPFTVDSIRSAQDPWSEAKAIDPDKFHLNPYIEKFDHYFDICGSKRFAETMASLSLEDLAIAKKTILAFSLAEVNEAAAFHGNIGDAKKVLDSKAAAEQALVLQEEESVKSELRQLGQTYHQRFGMKFLISAKGRSAEEIRSHLKRRMNLSPTEELQNAREALWEISQKRLQQPGLPILNQLEQLRLRHQVMGASISISQNKKIQTIPLGSSNENDSPVQVDTQFEIASLSKTIAAAFALEYFRKKNIPMDTSVNQLFAKTTSPFRLTSKINSSWADQVTIEHLLNHTALNMHYVNGFPLKNGQGEVPPVLELLRGQFGYEPVEVISEPGKSFHYSGGGFLVLEHLIESLEQKPIETLIHPFLHNLGIKNLSFDHQGLNCATGFLDSGESVTTGRLSFPAFAAGALGTSRDMAQFLEILSNAHHEKIDGSGISHDTAVNMCLAMDRGAREFMGCDIGLGVFIAEAGPNRLMIHQGANEGFRSLYIHCFRGPDFGKGLVIFCNADNKGVQFIAEAAQVILRELKIQGIDLDRFQSQFQFQNLKQEQIVNLGYKKLLFEAFEKDLPEKILKKGPKDPLAEFNLAVKSKILSASNQGFARAENLISDCTPVFDPDLYGRQGKIMDSWESVRHNQDLCDTLILELQSPSEIQFVSLSTMFHDGNQAQFVRLLGLTESDDWAEVLPKTLMAGHAILKRQIPRTVPLRQIKVEMYPDGGLSRLGVFSDLPANAAKEFTTDSQCQRFPVEIPKPHKPLTIPYQPTAEEIQKNFKRSAKVDWACAAFGGSVVGASNQHYGPAQQVISPFPAIHMFDGLESARSREPNHHEEVTIQLGSSVQIESIEMDFEFFVNNNPLYVSVSGASSGQWTEIVPKTKVKAFAGNQKVFKIKNSKRFDQILVKTFPDGGIGRIRVFGTPTIASQSD